MNRYAPYVYFTCPVSVATKINRRLIQLRGEAGNLNYLWTLEGTFNQEEKLCFSLASPTLERIQDSPIPPFVAFWLNRRKIDQDLAELAKRLNHLFDTLEAEDAETTPSIKG